MTSSRSEQYAIWPSTVRCSTLGNGEQWPAVAQLAALRFYTAVAVIAAVQQVVGVRNRVVVMMAIIRKNERWRNGYGATT